MEDEEDRRGRYVQRTGKAGLQLAIKKLFEFEHVGKIVKMRRLE